MLQNITAMFSLPATFVTTRLILYMWKVMTVDSIHSYSYDCSYNFSAYSD